MGLVSYLGGLCVLHSLLVFRHVVPSSDISRAKRAFVDCSRYARSADVHTLSSGVLPNNAVDGTRQVRQCNGPRLRGLVPYG
jgi:hypothetical protein